MWLRKTMTVAAFLCAVAGGTNMAAADDSKPEYALVIHGGAGTITRDKLTPELEADIRATLNEALSTGQTILSQAVRR